MSTTTVTTTRAIVTNGRGATVPLGRPRRRGVVRWIVAIVAIAIIVVYLSPIVWLILTSFKDRVDIFSSAPSLLFTPTLDNYIEAFVKKGFGDNLVNSAVVGVVSTLVAMVVGVPAAYSLSRISKGEGFMMALLAARLLQQLPQVAGGLQGGGACGDITNLHWKRVGETQNLG